MFEYDLEDPYFEYEDAGYDEMEWETSPGKRIPKGRPLEFGSLLLAGWRDHAPGFARWIDDAWAAARREGVSLGVGVAVSVSASFGIGAGVGAGVGLIFSSDGSIGWYGSKTGFFELVVTSTIAGAVGGSITLELTALRGGIETFDGLAIAAGGGATAPSGFTAMVKEVRNASGQRTGFAAEIGWEPSTEAFTGSARLFVEFTAAEVERLREMELEWEGDEDEIGAHVQRAIDSLSKRGVSKAKVRRALKDLRIEDAVKQAKKRARKGASEFEEPMYGAVAGGPPLEEFFEF